MQGSAIPESLVVGGTGNWDGELHLNESNIQTNNSNGESTNTSTWFTFLYTERNSGARMRRCFPDGESSGYC